MAQGETILTWNVANWITIILMAGIGFAILGFVQKAINNSGGDSGEEATS